MVPSPDVSRETLRPIKVRSLALVGMGFRPLGVLAQASRTHCRPRAPPACFARNIERLKTLNFFLMFRVKH